MLGYFTKLLCRNRTLKPIRTARRAPRSAHLSIENLEARELLSATALPSFITKELNALQTSIDQHLFSKSLPLVGTELNQIGKSIVGSFKQALIDGSKAALSGDMTAVQTAISNDLGSILQGITTTPGSKGDFTATLHLHDDSVLSSGKFDLNLGLAGLPFHLAAKNLAVDVTADYDINLAFGVQGGSPFLKTVADPKNTANPLGVAVDIKAQVEAGSSISATIGGLTASLTQLPITTSSGPVGGGGGVSKAAQVAALQIGGGFHVPDPTKIFPPSTFNATMEFGFTVATNGGIQLASPELTGAANINLQADLSLANDPSLPSLSSALVVNWAFKKRQPDLERPVRQHADREL